MLKHDACMKKGQNAHELATCVELLYCSTAQMMQHIPPFCCSSSMRSGVARRFERSRFEHAGCSTLLISAVLMRQLCRSIACCMLHVACSGTCDNKTWDPNPMHVLLNSVTQGYTAQQKHCLPNCSSRRAVATINLGWQCQASLLPLKARLAAWQLASGKA